ncbi:tetratricopeptide repeat protein [Bdellovibrio sp. HCB209]|uniref:tetratricopeptide repeat protein n=1 Tax=Bdellovibrio sp. HCB209 TaxID=3394354 RepID=UPI0039B3B200
MMFKLQLLVLTLMLGACSSKLVVQSEPSPASVTISVQGQNNRVKVGDTPLELTEVQIAETLKLSPESSQWIEFRFEKKDFESKTILLPSNRWGEMTKIVKIRLTPSEDASTTATKILKYFFNAKKFVETRQFEAAHQEVDKVLAIDSQNSQAMTMKAGIYYLQSNIDDARKLYKKALEIDPGSSDAIKMLEKIQRDQGGTIE